MRRAAAVLAILAGLSVTAASPAPAGAAGPAGETWSRASRLARTPVFRGDFADPFVLQVGTRFYAYATNAGGRNVPFGVATLRRAAALDGDALPELPAWTEPGHVWAPAVVALGDGYRLYYTTLDVASGRQCVSVASSRSPAGPFVDRSAAPLVCQVELGGSIDPSPVVDDAGLALVWKSDGNCCGVPTRIWSAPLTADGTRLASAPVAILGADRPWEGGLVEGPSMIPVGGSYLLFYSAGRWDSSSYATGYATCASVAGPCTKPAEGPWLATDEEVAGPGGGSAFRLPHGPAFFVFAAWRPGAVGYDVPGAVRHVEVGRITFRDGAPELVRR